MNTKPQYLYTLKTLTNKKYSSKTLNLLTNKTPIPTILNFKHNNTPKLQQQHTKHISISKIQNKLSLKLKHNKLQITNTNNNYILKPIPNTQLKHLNLNIPTNKHLTILLTRKIFNIKITTSALIHISNNKLTYITHHFNKETNNNKLPQKNFYQLLNHTNITHKKHYKYNTTYKDIFNTLKNFYPTYKIKQKKLFQLLYFNYLITNKNTHLKNFSIYQPNQNYILTPTYNLISTKLHLPTKSKLKLKKLYTNNKLTKKKTTHNFLTKTN